MWTQSLLVLLVCGLTEAGGEIGGKFLCTPDEFRGRFTYSNCPLLSLGQLLDTLLGLSTRYGSRREHLLYKMSVYVVVGSGRGSCHGQRVD